MVVREADYSALLCPRDSRMRQATTVILQLAHDDHENFIFSGIDSSIELSLMLQKHRFAELLSTFPTYPFHSLQHLAVCAPTSPGSVAWANMLSSWKLITKITIRGDDIGQFFVAFLADAPFGEYDTYETAPSDILCPLLHTLDVWDCQYSYLQLLWFLQRRKVCHVPLNTLNCNPRPLLHDVAHLVENITHEPVSVGGIELPSEQLSVGVRSALDESKLGRGLVRQQFLSEEEEMWYQ
ncbi:hypothetical protein SISSUDRAFT_1049450 [Sistotremastrum suecicum HHB10207 ss-3]|uniref:Uncharacterized protein n=1 Tax=Sistotremastrum suecicum HHB10207 ss-3 TaxID=1314776 RepID=A0A166BVN5_9AGAM|nr:hypothetical protein SISSUDRAFT_1049450 [Sistotremastrum suecicum HHB10207 ss-3]